VQSSALATTSKPRASSSEIARQALVIFGEICGREITRELAGIWASQLADIAPDLLQQACDRLAKTWTTSFLPTPGNVRAQIDQANANGLHLEIEEAWSRGLDWVQRYFHPDLGIARGAPELPAAIEHAIRAAGGMRWIGNCPASELQWAKKRFVEDFTRVHETRQTEHLLTRPEARRVLSDLTTAKSRRQVCSGPAAEETRRAKKPSSGEVREVLDRVTKNAPPAVAPTEEELRARWEDQKRRLALALARDDRSKNPIAEAPASC
jgi:hypothetical protein